MWHFTLPPATALVPGDNTYTMDVFVYDRETDTIERVSVASDGTQSNGNSFEGQISADGRYVAFYLIASNLVPDDTNGVVDVFMYDRQTDMIQRVSLAADGTQQNGDSGTLAIAPTAATWHLTVPPVISCPVIPTA